MLNIHKVLCRIVTVVCEIWYLINIHREQSGGYPSFILYCPKYEKSEDLEEGKHFSCHIPVLYGKNFLRSSETYFQFWRAPTHLKNNKILVFLEQTWVYLYRRCSMKKGVFQNFSKFTGKYLCQSLFFNKVAGLTLAFLFKKKSERDFFFCEFCELFT